MAQQYNSLIATIPTDAEIAAAGSYIPHMYNFPNLYQYPNVHGENKLTEYLLVSGNSVTNNEDDLAAFIANSYVQISSAGDMQLYKLK